MKSLRSNMHTKDYPPDPELTAALLLERRAENDVVAFCQKECMAMGEKCKRNAILQTCLAEQRLKEARGNHQAMRARRRDADGLDGIGRGDGRDRQARCTGALSGRCVDHACHHFWEHETDALCIYHWTAPFVGDKCVSERCVRAELDGT